MSALSCGLGSWHQRCVGVDVPGGGRNRFRMLSVASGLVSPWGVLAVLLGSRGLQTSRLTGSALFGRSCQEAPPFPTLSCTINLAGQWLCQLLAASFPSLFAGSIPTLFALAGG